MAVNDIVMGAAGAGGPATYIEDVFSTWLYTSSGANRSIVNNIDLSTKGGMVLFKGRTSPVGGYGWGVFDKNRGVQKALRTNTDEASFTDATSLTAFNANGFSLGIDNNLYVANAFGSGAAVSWTFREQPKFFDVVTYTGTGANRTISHSLGAVPACIMIKRLDTIGDWQVYHRSLANTEYLVLNSSAAKATGATRWNSTTPTDAVFSVGTDATVNASGGTYVAYIYAHDAGGFGALGTDNVISCGSFTTNASGVATVNLGYEPQWLFFKHSTAAQNWIILDNMRGLPVGDGDAVLSANTTTAEGLSSNVIDPTATGFNVVVLSPNATYIYITIRRPMKTPTTGTEVFSPNTRTGTSAVATISNIGLTPDLYMVRARNIANDSYIADRLRGTSVSLISQYGFDEASVAASIVNTFNMNGATIPAAGAFNNTSPNTYIDYFMRRAPCFFDEVCYTGTGANTTQAHNLTVAPELWIVKGRSGATAWQVGSTALANTEYLVFNGNDAKATGATRWNSTYPTASVFSLGTATTVNTSAATYVAYLFATLAGVSKVGSYTGNGSSQTINCSFTTGARFVMIKRTNSTGDWYFWDSARGIVAGNDPYSAFNTSTAEVTSNDSVDADSSGFIVNQLAATNINVNAATYIFLAIA